MAVAAPATGRDARVISMVGIGHFLSHFYILVLPPLFPILKDELGVGYSALGLVITTFNVASGVAQVPVGFLVDRFGARSILTLGLIIEALAILAVGLTGTYAWMLVLVAVAGLANSVYHPADYAILSASIGEGRMGRAFSLHTFAGYVGNAVAPGAMVLMATLWDWKTALMLAGCLGLVVATVLLLGGEALNDRRARPAPAPKPGQTARVAASKSGMALLLSPPILMCFLFFVMLSMSSSGLNSFAVAALVDLYDTPLAIANAALTGFLVGNAIGILIGGIIADRTRYHERVAMLGFGATAVIVALIGNVALPPVVMAAAFSLGGLLFGMIMPSRDMLVRAVTPEGSMGKVFGFVSTGLNVGSALTPALFGLVMDFGDPRWLFWLAPFFMLLALGTVIAAKATR